MISGTRNAGPTAAPPSGSVMGTCSRIRGATWSKNPPASSYVRVGPCRAELAECSEATASVTIQETAGSVPGADISEFFADLTGGPGQHQRIRLDLREEDQGIERADRRGQGVSADAFGEIEPPVMNLLSGNVHGASSPSAVRADSLSARASIDSVKLS